MRYSEEAAGGDLAASGDDRRAAPYPSVPAIIRKWHRLYRDVDDELLLFIDDAFAHGLFRNWVHFTKSFQQVFPRCRVDEARARAVFGLFGGTGGA